MPIRHVTYNVRYATKTPVKGEELWQVRCPKLCNQLRFITTGHPAAFLCLQEVLYSQLLDIQSELGDDWSHIGQARDDGHRAGEFSPIFYQPATWNCERSQTYWLSPTPEKPSKGWDAALNRIVTMGLFSHVQTGARVIVMATHLDHQGETARIESAKLILKLAAAWQSDSQSTQASAPLPVLLGGDFNSRPSTGAYQTITAPGTGMEDVSKIVPRDHQYGNHELTYTSFGEPGETPKRIDFLFVKEHARVRFVTFAILSNRFDSGVYFSDHRPVVADMEIRVPVE